MQIKDLDLNLLTGFQRVAQEGSVSKASRHLHITQPALSLQIRRLEDQLGGRLFDRQNRGLKLTALGRTLLTQVRSLNQTLEALHAAIHEFHEEPSGIVEVGTYTTASSYLLAPRLAAFLRSYPKITVRYCYDPTHTILEKIVENELHCAVLSEVPADPKFDLAPFFQDELILAAGAQHPIGDEIRPSQLADADFLSYPLRHDLCYQSVEQRFGRYLAKARVPLETTSFDTLKQTLLSGVGVTFIPRYLISRELEQGLLREVKVNGPRLPIEFYIVTKKNAVHSRAARVWMEAVRAAQPAND